MINSITHEPRLHIFRIGDIVAFAPQEGGARKPTGSFSVIAHLPPLGDDLQYLVKSEHEPHQRVVMEQHLVRVQRQGALDFRVV